jgi:hypothetical protein
MCMRGMASRDLNDDDEDLRSRLGLRTEDGDEPEHGSLPCSVAGPGAWGFVVLAALVVSLALVWIYS